MRVCETIDCKVNWRTYPTLPYLKIAGWGWYYLSTILDDYSRYIIAWELRTNMTSEDVKPSIELALLKSRLTKKTAPKLLSDNRSCYVSSEIRSFFRSKGIEPINGKPCHPQTQGKIERYHRTMKNMIKLEHYFTPEELELAIGEFVDFYNNRRYHEALKNLTPADVYFGRDKKILEERALTKQLTIRERRRQYYLEKHIEANFV